MTFGNIVQPLTFDCAEFAGFDIYNVASANGQTVMGVIFQLAWLISYLVLAVILWRIRRWIASTTLLGPWMWCVGAMVATASYGAWSQFRSVPPDDSVLTWRFIAAAFLLCPEMSLLGARRPQQHAWHFVVAGLWLVLILPALESLLRGGGRPLEIDGPRWLFLVFGIGLTPLNAMGTKCLIPALLLLAAQLLWFWPWLAPETYATNLARNENGILITLAIVLSAVAAAWVERLFSRPKLLDSSVNRIWIDFRDSFGTVWAIRVMDRVNQALSGSSTADRLEWDGFHGTEIVKAETCLRHAIWRFVSEQWIGQRLVFCRSENVDTKVLASVD